MRLIETVKDRVLGALAGGLMGHSVQQYAMDRIEIDTADALAREAAGLAELEIAMDDRGWSEMIQTGSWNFSRRNLMKLVNLARVCYLVNPLIRRAVTVQELYVWGSGCTVKAEDETVQEVLDDFYNDPKNQAVIGDAWPEREREQRIDGNTFFAFFVNKRTGAVRVRLIPVDQIQDIYSNPDDAKEPRFYHRSSQSVQFVEEITNVEETLYPDILYNPKSKPSSINGVRVDWDVRILHIKTGGLSMMKFGIPELYSSISWAVAYKRILENFSTILAAYARVAMKISGAGGKAKPAAAKSRLGTSITSGSPTETAPPTNTASWMALSGGMDINAVKTANSTTGPDEARALRSMVAAGSDTPEHFFGDSDVGNFATSSTLDRPTELKMVARQNMWKNVMQVVNFHVLVWSAQASMGKLRTAGFTAVTSRDAFDGTLTVNITPPKDKRLDIAIVFPSILERDVTDRVRAVVMAATLGGRSAEGIIPDRAQVYKLLMVALGEKEADRLVQKYYPKEVIQGFKDPGDMSDNDRLEAEGKRDLGKAALAQAAVAKVNAEKPAPKPVVASGGGE